MTIATLQRDGRLSNRELAEQVHLSESACLRRMRALEEAGVIDRLEFGDGRARYEESGQHHEHLVDVETGEVLMMAWMNAESLSMTFAEGRMVYWSRSRQELWRNYQEQARRIP